MQRLKTLALSSLLLGNFALADNSTVNDELQQQIQDRNAVIGVSLERKLDALLQDRSAVIGVSLQRQIDALLYDRIRENGLTAQRQYITGNLLVAAL